REVRGEPLAADHVVVRERRRRAVERKSLLHARRDDVAPSCLPRAELLAEAGVEQEVREVRIAIVGGLDAPEELRADDAAVLPDARELAEAEAPVARLARDLEEPHALRVAARLRGVEGGADVGDELLLVTRRRRRRPDEHLRRLHAILLSGGDDARLERGRDR